MAFIFSKIIKEGYACQLKSTRVLNYFNCISVAGHRLMTSEVEKAQAAKHQKPKETIFDKILSKQLPADIIFEDDKCMAFNDVNPQAPTHFLVIPKKRIATLDASSEEDKEVLGHVLLTAKQLAQKRLPNGYRVVINNGPDGCQSVHHLHVHILGGRQMNWPPG